MFRKLSSRTYCVLLLILGLFISCQKEEEVETQQVSSDDTIVAAIADSTVAVVLVTDSTEWHVCIADEHLLYSKAVEVQLPSPWLLPTREDAAILKTCTYPHDERFITSDGYTFGMPSASVTKAGQKTEYSVLGLWKRQTVIVVEF